MIVVALVPTAQCGGPLCPSVVGSDGGHLCIHTLDTANARGLPDLHALVNIISLCVEPSECY